MWTRVPRIAKPYEGAEEMKPYFIFLCAAALIAVLAINPKMMLDNAMQSSLAIIILVVASGLVFLHQDRMS